MATRVAPPRKKMKSSGRTRAQAASAVDSASSAHLSGTPTRTVERVMGKYERLAYERQERDLREAYGSGGAELYGDPGLSQHPKGFWWDPEAGERVVQFIENYCKHHKGEWAGQPLTLEEWQRFCIRVTYGWKKPDGTRRFQISYREVARKNGKTEQSAGEAVYLQIADDEPGAEVYSTATKEDQAKIVWTAAEAMVKQSPDLKRFIRPYTKSLVCQRNGSFFKPLGSDSSTLDGLNPSAHICDEMHAHKNRGVWDVMITGMGARRQPLTIVITTAGIYNPESIGWELHTAAQQILDGVIEDDTMFCIIFAADEGDDPKALTTWQKANPNFGVSVKPSYIEDQCDRAFRTPSALNTFLRLHLNVWTQQVTKWIPIEDWNACASPELLLLRTLSADWIAKYKGRPAFLGADLSTKIDITALSVVLPAIDGTDVYDVFWRFYVPAGLVLKRSQDHKLPDYAAWVKNGWLIETPGDVIDYGFILNDCIALRQSLVTVQLGFDPWNATQFMIDLSRNGFVTEVDEKQLNQRDLLVELRQGMKTMSEPCKELEKLVISRKLRHNGDPVMRWMVDNAVVRRDANENIAPDKRSATGKIDGVVATAMGLGRAMLRPVVNTNSVYEKRGVRVLTARN